MITSEQREQRRQYLGSSDMAAVLGLDTYRSAADVYLEKTGRVADFAGNDATDRGNLLEPVMLQWAEQELAAPITRDLFCPGPAESHLCANLDGDCESLNSVIEVKTSTNPDEWGEPGTDEVPDRVIVQTHVAMLCRGRKQALVPVLLPGFKSFDFRMYRVEFNANVAAAILAKASSFWRQHVMADTPPVGSVTSIEVLKRMRRVPSKIVALPDALVDRWIVCRAARLQAEKDEDWAYAEVLAALGDAEGGTYSAGELTYFESKRKGYVVKDSAYRTLRIKGAKALAAKVGQHEVL